MHSSDIEYHYDDVRLIGHLAVPDGDGLRPAVLVCHEGPGLDSTAKDIAERLANDFGYVAFALDYHGDGVTLDRAEMMPRLGALMADPDRARGLAKAGLAVLLEQPLADQSRVAAIGYCFGGTLAMELARSGADLRAVVGFHAGLGTSRPEDATQIRAKVLMCIGCDDPFIPVQQRLDFETEMEAAHVDWRLNLYGGVHHSFTNPLAVGVYFPGVAYDEVADKRSWRAMCDLFDEVFV